MHVAHSEICEQNTIHEDVVRRVSEAMPAEEPVYELSELFRVFGDSTRARIICALTISEMCVCDLSALLRMTQSAISHQLRILKAARLVKYRRSGKIVYYTLADDHIKALFDLAFAHVIEELGGDA